MASQAKNTFEIPKWFVEISETMKNYRLILNLGLESQLLACI